MPAAWCNASGKTLLILRVLATSDGYLLLLPDALVDGALKRLRMFVLRLKVILEDVGARFTLTGQIDAANADKAVASQTSFRLALPRAANQKSRELIVCPAGHPLPDNALPVGGEIWQLSEIDSGVPQITPATQGVYVPQMLNLHWLHAMDFDKGCYPGQETIARLHYRGRLTRRVFRLGWQGSCPMPGEKIHHSSGQSVGQILQSAGAGEGRALAVLRIDSANRTSLTTSHSTLTLLDLPYETPG